MDIIMLLYDERMGETYLATGFMPYGTDLWCLRTTRLPWLVSMWLTWIPLER
jgi:hypothetical protein